MADEIDHLSIKELRQIITAAGLSYADCIEKSDLRKRARDAVAAAKQCKAASAAAPVSAGESRHNLAGYDCIINSPSADGKGVDLIVIVLHGYGASNDNFSSFPSHFEKMSSRLKGKRVVWIFPQALLDRSGTPAWWQIDVMEWMMAQQGGQENLARLIRKEFEGMAQCRKKMQQLLEEVVTLFPGRDGSSAPLIFGGFSQGAMTAMDVTLSLPPGKVAGVVMLSGAPITVDAWQPLLKERKGKLKVLVTHGKNDPVLPFAGSGWLNDLLCANLNPDDVRYEIHNGGHELGRGMELKLLDFLGSFV